MISLIEKKNSVYYVYKKSDGNLIISTNFLDDKSLNDKQAFIKMETNCWEDVLSLVSEEIYNNMFIEIEMMIESVIDKLDRLVNQIEWEV